MWRVRLVALPGVVACSATTAAAKRLGVDCPQPKVPHVNRFLLAPLLVSLAASALKRSGYDDVRNVVGGMDAWRAAGLPVE